MRLSDYLEANAIPDAEFAAQIGADRSTVSRLRRIGQIPSPKLMAEIGRATAGAVTPNDFFGLPVSDAQAAA